MTTVPVTKCKPDPRLFYNRKWTTIKGCSSSKGNRKVYDFADYHHQKVHKVKLKGSSLNKDVDYVLDTKCQSVKSNFPALYEKEGMNTDIKPMAVYVHGCKGVMKQNEIKECLDILNEMLGDLA